MTNSLSPEIKIETGIPTPRAYNRKYPLSDMKPGDSFFVANAAPTKLHQVGHYGRKLFPGSKWVTRTVTENGVVGVRVWRAE